jgi:hypothetical protein
VEDHDSSAVWLGKQLQCHLEPLQKFQQHVATEIKAGKDEAALLWPFVYAVMAHQLHVQSCTLGIPVNIVVEDLHG